MISLASWSIYVASRESGDELSNSVMDAIMQYGVIAILVACQPCASRGSSAGVDPSLAETLFRNSGIHNNENKVNKTTDKGNQYVFLAIWLSHFHPHLEGTPKFSHFHTFQRLLPLFQAICPAEHRVSSRGLPEPLSQQAMQCTSSESRPYIAAVSLMQ